jgi:tetratricopeptide (TPR) repeat protein
VPEAVEAMVERALAKDPAQRYESAAEFRDALLAASADAKSDMAMSTYSPDAAAANARARTGGAERLGGLPGLYQGMLEAASDNNWQQVLELGQAIRGMDPNYRDVVALMARASAQQYAEQNRSGAVELRLLEQARGAWAGERWADAVQLFEQALRLVPPTPEVEAALAEARRRLADSESQARQRARFERQYVRATLLFEEGRWYEAEQEFGRLLDVAPNFRDAESLRARAREARLEQDRQAGSGTVTPQQTLEQAQQAMSLGEWALAAQLLEQLVHVRPGSRQLEEQLATARVMTQIAELNAEAALLVEKGFWAEAMAKMEEAKQLDPHYQRPPG